MKISIDGVMAFENAIILKDILFHYVGPKFFYK